MNQTAKPCAVRIALNPPSENHVSGEGAKLCFCCWSQLGQGKYLDNINSCGESKTPAYFSRPLLIILLIIWHVLKAEPSAVGQWQSFCCWLWPSTVKLWCSAELPHTTACLVVGLGWLRAGSRGWCLAGHAERGCPLAKSFMVQWRWRMQRAGDGLRGARPPCPWWGSPVLLLCSAGWWQMPLSWGYWGRTKHLGDSGVTCWLLFIAGCQPGPLGAAQGRGLRAVRLPSQCLQPLGLVGDEAGTVSQGTWSMKGPAWARRVLPGSLGRYTAPAVGWEGVSGWGESPQPPLSLTGHCRAG